MKLADTQICFQDYLLGRAEAMMPLVKDNGRIASADLLLIYRRGYALRLVEALANDFPGLKGLLGEEAFDRLARGYVADNPSQHASLRWLGRRLPDYLTGLDPAPHRLAADMARFDWAVALAFDAGDQQIAGLPDLLALPPTALEGFRLVFANSVSDFIADAAVGAMRHALLRDATDMPAASRSYAHWLIWRRQEEVQYRSLDDDEAAALELMQAGGTFSAMCQLLAEKFDQSNAALRSAEILKDWLERGLVAAIEHDAALSL
jgi:hypothetical protein